MCLSELLEQASSEEGVEPYEIVIGMVVKATVVTDIPQADFKLTIHCVTKDEKVKGVHEVAVPANGMTLHDVSQTLYGKFVLVIADSMGRGTIPLKGKLDWSSAR